MPEVGVSSRSLPRSSAIEQQVDPVGILAFLDALEGRPDIEMHSVMIVRHGHVVAEGWWHPYSADRPQLLYSLSKSFTSSAVAFAAAEGLLDLDDTVISHFPEFDADVTDSGSRSIRIRHIAAMASGHEQETWGQAVAMDPHEPVRGFLLIPPDRPPGTVFAYNQPCTFTLASIVQRKAQMPLTKYLRPRLFDPLGIGEVGWQTFAGREQGYTGLHARTEDIAKLGQLYLQRGRWGDTQLIAADWVDQATSKQVDNSMMSNPDWQQGYGFQFWMARHGYRGDGAFGQFCIVLPEHDTVIATTASTLDMQAVLDAVWAHILPALGQATRDAGAQEQLATRLGKLELEAYQDDAEPRRWEPWLTGPFEVETSSDTTLTSLHLDRIGDGWQVTLRERNNRVTFAVGTGGWSVSAQDDAFGNRIPVAAAGGWSDQNTLHLEVIFLETPHRLDVTCSLDTHRARVAWRLPPLGSSRLQDLRCPV